MIRHAYLTDWHQIFLVAAGFLTAILLVWSQHWVRSFYEEQPYDHRPLADMRFTTHIMRLWLVVGVAFALCAFGLTGLDWLLAGKTIQCSLAACLLGRMQQLAAGFLIGAFDITLIGILIEIFNAGRTVMTKGQPGRIDYTDKKKTSASIAICVALFLILISCLILAWIPPSYWWLLILGSLIIPLLIVGGTFAWALFDKLLRALFDKASALFSKKAKT